MFISPANSEPNYTGVDQQSKEQSHYVFHWREMEHSANMCQEALGHVIIMYSNYDNTVQRSGSGTARGGIKSRQANQDTEL